MDVPRPRRIGSISACAGLILLVTAGLLGGPVAAAGSVPSLIPVPGARASVLPGSTDLGRLPERQIRGTLVLALNNRGGLEQLIRDQYRPGSAVYREFLTPADFAARFAPSAATVAAAQTYLRGQGLQLDGLSANRTLLSFHGPSPAVAAAFGVDLHRYRARDGRVVFGISQAPRLPSWLAPRVTSVLGLTDVATSHTTSHAARSMPASGTRPGHSRAAAPGGYPTAYGPRDLWSIYDAPDGVDGSGQNLAIIAAGDIDPAVGDLRIFEQQNGLPAIPVQVVHVGQVSSDLTGQPEWDIDMQYSTGFAPGAASLTAYVGNGLDDQSLEQAVNQFVVENKARQASMSIDTCEFFADASGYRAALDQSLAQGVAQGQTLFNSTGDWGSTCPSYFTLLNGAPDGQPGVAYPSSSPYVVAVGGTTLLSSGGRHTGEVAWYAGGGGVSTVYSAPDFQASAGGSFLPVARGIPDVSIDADPESGYIVIVKGTPTAEGGTSVGAPAWAGIWARAQQAHGGHLGYANPSLYRMPAASFHDVLIGYQGLFAATPGWDYTTGRGAPDISAVVNSAG